MQPRNKCFGTLAESEEFITPQNVGVLSENRRGDTGPQNPVKRHLNHLSFQPIGFQTGGNQNVCIQDDAH